MEHTDRPQKQTFFNTRWVARLTMSRPSVVGQTAIPAFTPARPGACVAARSSQARCSLCRLEPLKEPCRRLGYLGPLSRIFWNNDRKTPECRPGEEGGEEARSESFLRAWCLSPCGPSETWGQGRLGTVLCFCDTEYHQGSGEKEQGICAKCPKCPALLPCT